jgi:hypothetical protein
MGSSSFITGDLKMKIDFEFQTKHGVFRDALHLPDNHGYSEEEIQAMKEQRRDNWIDIVDNPPPPPESEYVEIDGVQYEKVEIDGQIVLKPVQSSEE